MGTWGVHVFQNDAAQDLVDEILEGTYRLDEHRQEYRAEEDALYIDAEAGARLLALGALVRVARNEDAAAADALAEIADTDELDLDGLLEQFTDEDLQQLRELIAITLREPASSELYELWEESGELEEWLEASRTAIPD
ncbi:DUF4259 domain-containing protein [Micrococcus sp.]|uniref:DUF4259 domain-containing protein n=1 Tax=Micrococcus sp. TaxID=1271 RepID=UPI002A90F302|nr:DUF4259 domain-containing protein [Micrococcus sp.]MDY6054996.1 DUF4259 domain-containing protein [Micrococcus sp.]